MRCIAPILALTVSLGCPSSGNEGGGSTDAAETTASSDATETPTPATSESGATTAPSEDDSTGEADTTSDGGSTGVADSSGGCALGTAGCPCDEGACEGALLCTNDVCERESCDPDRFEPNDDEATATDLGRIDDLDSSGGTVEGSLDSDSDVDWYRYAGDDDIGSVVDPARTLVASAGIRMCKFFECDNGLAQTEFDCPDGADYALSSMARPGCCSTSGEIALPELNCADVSEDNAAVYIRIDLPEQVCTTYELSYHY